MTRFSNPELNYKPRPAERVNDNKTQRQKNKDICDELVANQEYLTDWEVNFVKTCKWRTDNFYELSDKQQDILSALPKKVAERMDEVDTDRSNRNG